MKPCLLRVIFPFSEMRNLMIQSTGSAGSKSPVSASAANRRGLSSVGLSRWKEINTMITILTVLFCIGNTPPGLSLSPSTTIVQKEALPSPILWAEPGSIISWGKSVTILCQGNIQAQEYYLNKEGRTSRLYSQTVMEPGSKAMFPILFITELYAGRYHCYCESPAGSSEHSDMLELVVTDVYSKPSLSALPSSVVTPGENVTFQCISWLGFETFILTEEGENKLSWTGDSQRHPNGHMQALFPMGPVSPGHRRKFRCYGYDNSNAQVWSAPSEPLELIISGMVETNSSSPNMSDPKTGSHLQDHTVENLTRITLGGLVLLVLGILLFDAQHSQRKTPDAARR